MSNQVNDSIKLNTMQQPASYKSVVNTDKAKAGSVMTSANIDKTTTTTTNITKSKEASTNNSIDKIINILINDDELKKYNITAEDIKNSGIFQKLPKHRQYELEHTENAKHFEQIVSCFKQGILDSIENGKINFDKALKNTNDYFIVIHTGWDSAQSFKKWNDARQATKVSILKRLQNQGYIDNNKDLSKVSREELKEAVKNFIETCAKEFNNASTSDDKEKIKAQLQTFGRALYNSNQEERKVFFEVAKYLHADNKLPGFKAIMESYLTEDQQEDLVDYVYGDKKYIQDLTCGKNPVSKDNAIGINKIAAENCNEDQADKYTKQEKENRANWLNENKEKLEQIKKKIQTANENNTEVKLTDEERQILLESENFIEGGLTGGILGIANGILPKEAKKETLERLNNEAIQISEETYKKVIESLNKYIKENPNSFNVPTEKIETTINNATNENYQALKRDSNANLNLHKTETINNNEIGYTRKTPEEIALAQANINRFKENQAVTEKEIVIKPIVEKNVNTNNNTNSINFKNDKNSFVEYIQTKFYQSNNTKFNLTAFIKTLTCNNILKVFDTLKDTHIITYLAEKATIAGKLSLENIAKLNKISVGDKNHLKDLYYQFNKNANKELA